MLSRTRISVLLIGLISLRALAADPVWQGRPLGDYIGYLAGQGIEIIYSSDLVRAGYIVVVEPAGGEPVELLRDALRAYGLTVSAGPGSRWLVIRDPNAADSEAKPGANEDAGGPSLPLPEIIVSSSVYSIRYQKAGSHIFLDRDFTTGLPDVGEETLRPLDRLPGVASGGVSARTHIRGGADNEQLIIFDGLRLYEPYHLKDFHSVATTVDQSAVDGIDFYTAGYQARYGDRMSGVIDIGMRQPGEAMETELGLSFFNTWALSTGRFSSDKRGDWLVSAKRSNLDLLTRAFKPEFGSPKFSDLLTHIGWQLTDRTYVAMNYLYSFDNVRISQEDGSEVANARYRNRVSWLKVETEWSPRVSSSTILRLPILRTSGTGGQTFPK